MSRHAPGQGPRRTLLWALFDLAWVVLATGVYALSLAPSALMLTQAQARWGLAGVLVGALPSYVVFLLALSLVTGALQLVSPRIEPGVHPRMAGRGYFRLVWRAGIGSLVQATPFLKHIHLLSVLRWIYYRGQGMQAPFDAWMGVNVRVSDPSLVTLGRGASLGDFAMVTCHLALPTRMVILPVRIGDGALVGGAVKIGPGVEIGPGALIGADSVLSVNVKVGEGAYVEPFSRVDADVVIGPYERWGGSPAVKVGERERGEAAG